MITGIVQAKDLGNNWTAEHHLLGRKLKAVVTRKSYCVELKVEEMLKVLANDKSLTKPSLLQLLRAEGATQIEYDGHFGPNVFFTLDAADDKNTRLSSEPGLRDRCLMIIREYIRTTR